MNALAFVASTGYPISFSFPLSASGLDYSRGCESADYPALLSPVDQAEVEEALALSDLGVTCFNCCFGASFQRSGQFWCSTACWVDVMNGGCDYWYHDDQEIGDEEGAATL